MSRHPLMMPILALLTAIGMCGLAWAAWDGDHFALVWLLMLGIAECAFAGFFGWLSRISIDGWQQSNEGWARSNEYLRRFTAER